MGLPCLTFLLGWKNSIFFLFFRMEMEEEEIHDMIKKLSLGGMLKKWRACLMKDHSIRS